MKQPMAQCAHGILKLRGDRRFRRADRGKAGLVALETEPLPARYHDPRRIGRGGMGEIYRATDELLGRPVAIKVLSERYRGDEAVRERFTREALAAARLSGRPNIVTIFDVGEWQGTPYIVMEYLGGGTLEECVRAGRIPLGRALEWLGQAAMALDAAHADGVIHRDVKPANLLLDEHGNVHVADFGIANAAGMDSLTKTGTVLGTAAYLSPEQAQGERATAASDRYGLAVVGWELLTGRRPFSGDTIAAEAAAHVHAEIPSLSEVQPDLPWEIDDVFRRALAKDPAARFASAVEFVAAVAGAVHASAERTAAFATPVVSHPRRAPARPAWIVPAIVALALLGAGLIAAAILASNDRGEDAQGTTVVRTVTTEGETQRVTVTARAEPAPEPTAAPPASGLSVSQARALQDESTAAMAEGDWTRALALAQQALPALAGRDRTYEGYANYNIGRSLAELGRCEEALPYLERREQLGGPHPAVDATRRRCGGE
jgi:tRNA A-37 threonylcarbamoyl transferase component Bud32